MDRFNGINSRSKNWYNLARRVPCEPRSIPLLTFASILCARWFVGNHCQEGLTWAFLHESLYLRERARNINPGLVHEPTRPPVPQRDWTRWNTKIWTRGELPIGLDTSSYRADSSGKGLKGFVGVLVTDDSRKFFFSFRLVCAWFSLLDGRVLFWGLFDMVCGNRL